MTLRRQWSAETNRITYEDFFVFQVVMFGAALLAAIPNRRVRFVGFLLLRAGISITGVSIVHVGVPSTGVRHSGHRVAGRREVAT